MFYRGQRIEVIESSAKGNAHPRVGDLGYLNNMFWFYKDRFILADAFFFSYRNESIKGKARSERKKFIIDLGMTSDMRRRILMGAAKVSLFAGSKQVVNLLQIAERNTIISSSLETFPPLVGPYGIWYKKNKESGTRIPIVNIRNSSGRYSLLKTHPNEANAWIKCLLSVVSVHLAHLPPATEENVESVHYRFREAFNQMQPHLIVKPMEDKIIFKLKSIYRTDIIIRWLKFIQMLAESYAIRDDSWTAKNLAKDTHSGTTFSAIWQAFGFTEIRSTRQSGIGGTEALNYYNLDAATSIILRSLLVAPIISRNLLILSGNYVCWNHDIIADKAVQFGKLREEAKSGSAALARIYEEKMLS